MKRLINIIFMVSVFLMMVAPAAMADTISSGDYVKLIAYNPFDSAGIMTYAVSHDKGVNTSFNYDTFCIQNNVYVTPGTWYPVWSLSNTVGLFDSPPPAGAGPLNGAVDYLFYRYKSGVYDTQFTGLNANDNEADLQELLWSLQGSGPAYSSSGYLWDTDLSTYNATPWMQQKSWGTEVINIASIGSDGKFKDIQNQLYNQVPEPSTLLLLGCGLCALRLARRRK